MERKKTKNWIFDRAATLIVVAAMVSTLFMMTLPSERINAGEAKGIIDAVSVTPSKITSLSDGEFEVEFKNTSGSAINDIDIEADLGDSLSPKGLSKLHVNSLPNDEIATAKFKYSVKAGTKSGEYIAAFTINGEKSGTAISPVVVKFPYVIDLTATVPQVVLSSSDNFKSITPSTTDRVKISINNKSQTKSIKNIRLVCESGFESGTGLTRGYTENYIQDTTKEPLASNDEMTLEVPFHVESNISKGTHELVFVATYEDTDGNSYKTDSMTMYVEYKAPSTAEPSEEGLPYEPVKGYSFEEEINPGKTTHVRTLITNFRGNVVGENYFDSFGLETSDERIVATNLTLTDANTRAIYYPNSYNTSNGIRNAYTGYGNYILEFDISCADTLEPGKYTVNYYGITLYDQYGSAPNTIVQGTTIKSYKYPLIKFSVTNDKEAKSATVGIDSITYNKSNMMPSSSNAFAVKIVNTGSVDVKELYIVAELGESLSPDYEMKKLRVGSLNAGVTTTFKVPFTVNSNAKSGSEEIIFKVSGVDKYGHEVKEVSETLFVKIGTGSGETPSDAPSLALSTKQNYKLLKPSTDDNVIIMITNKGTKKAKGIRLTCESGLGIDSGLTKNFTTSYIPVDDIAGGETVQVEVPFLVGATFSKGIHELVFSATYSDTEKNSYKSEQMTMYVEHYKTGDMESIDGLTYLQISGVTQAPASPAAGDKVTVTFTVTNKGTEKVTNLQFYGTGLSAAGFQPVTGEPSQSEGSLDAGEKKTVTMTFRAGEDIPKGVNALTIGYDFFDSSNKAHQASSTVYILNVINHKFDEIDVGRPKIIVSDYSTEPENLRAGETFDFTYTLKNTHTGKEARNIKITLSQAEGVLAPAQGTNIFYIDKLDPTQEVVLSLPMKSRADTVTGDYPVVLKLEYEYDDMSAVDKEHGGVSEENILKIRVVENYRPVIENIFLDAYQGIIVGQPVDLSFEFYNMGKSTLGNVYITIEGDFALANNSAMSYVGAVQGYGQEYLSPQVVPLVGGEAHGTVTIHFEDSNGDEQTKSSDFQAWVEDPMGGGDFGGEWNMSFGNISGGFYSDFGGGFPEGFEFGEQFGMEGEGEEEGFFASIPWWVWVIVSVVVVGGVVVIIVVIKKRKAKKEADEEDNEDI